jgi:hypothetical protein
VHDDDEGSGESGLGGMNAFFAESLLLIPQDEVFVLFFAKIEESSAFSGFLEKLSSSDYENVMENMKVGAYTHTLELSLMSCLSHLQQNHGIRELYFDLHAHGIDLLEWVKSLKGFAGY